MTNVKRRYNKYLKYKALTYNRTLQRITSEKYHTGNKICHFTKIKIVCRRQRTEQHKTAVPLNTYVVVRNFQIGVEVRTCVGREVRGDTGPGWDEVRKRERLP